MEYIPTEIEDVFLIKPSVFEDERGYFFESYRRNRLKKEGIQVEFVQDNVSFSRRNTVRGLHYQVENPQDKLIMVLQGEVRDVAVDLRKNKDTFGEHVSRKLSGRNHHQMLIPKGFAHGFSVLSKAALIYYKCSDYYNPNGERGVYWDDDDLQIDWQVDDPIISEKDRQQPTLTDLKDEDLFAE